MKNKNMNCPDLEPLDKDIECSFDYHHNFMSRIVREAAMQHEKKIIEYLQKNLKSIGYAFRDDAHFIDFASKRITKVTSDNLIYDFFLDYDMKTNKGFHIGFVSNKGTMTEQDGIFTYKIG